MADPNISSDSTLPRPDKLNEQVGKRENQPTNNGGEQTDDKSSSAPKTKPDKPKPTPPQDSNRDHDSGIGKSAKIKSSNIGAKINASIEPISEFLEGLVSRTSNIEEHNKISDDDYFKFRRKAAKTTATNEVAEELALVLGIVQCIRNDQVNIRDATSRISYIFDCLFHDKPQLILARDERLRLQYEVYSQAGRLSRFLAWISAGSSVSLVLAALLTSLVCWTAIVLGVHFLVSKIESNLVGSIFFMNGKALAVVVSSAFIGGVISIATRLQEFARVRDLDPFAMFWTATLKPLVGVVLSMFILATLAGDVISFSFLGPEPFGFIFDSQKTLDNKTLYILWMLAFLAGFSERFAYDFVDRAQGVAGSTPAVDTPTPK